MTVSDNVTRIRYCVDKATGAALLEVALVPQFFRLNSWSPAET